VTLWDVANNKQVFQYREPPPGNPKNPTTGSGIHDVVFQPNGFVSVFQGYVLQRWGFASDVPAVRSLGDLSSYTSTLVGVHSVTGTIFIYAVNDTAGHSVYLINPSGTQVTQHHTFRDRLWTTAIANKQQWFVGVTRNREAIVIDMKTGKELARLPVASGSAVARFGADDKYLAVRAGVDIEIFDTTTWKKIQSLPSSSDNFAIHPKGQHIATVTSSGDVEIYDINTKKLLNTLVSKSTSKGINILKYDPTGSYIGFGSDRYGTAEVWTCAP
jgi:WD40 repeat protein